MPRISFLEALALAKLTAVRDRPQAPVPTFVLATAVAGMVLGAAITAFMIYISFSYSRQISAYENAPACASPRELSNCRFVSSARVVDKRMHNSDHVLDLTFIDLGGTKYEAIFTNNISTWQSTQIGATVNGELWQGFVSKVNGSNTATNPDTLPNSGPVAALFFGAVTLVVTGVFVRLLSVNRRARHGAG